MKARARTYTVTELNHLVRETLRINPLFTEGLWVAGEVQNMRVQQQSGHVYFTLTDETCSVRAAFFNGLRRSPDYIPENGKMVRVFGRVDVYVNRGEYQIYVERWEPLPTEGERRLQFLRIRERLAADGLLREQRGARALPLLPRYIGLITSSEGAAFHDVLRVSWRRFPGARFVFFPATVQGDQTAPSVISGLEAMARLATEHPIDVIMVVRGGGSLEDLWYFNDEGLARKISAMPVPVVTGIGHEIDTTIADLVADVQAATPSNAAERVVPDVQDHLNRLNRQAQRLASATMNLISERQLHLGKLEAGLHLRSPERLLMLRKQAVETALHRLTRAMERIGDHYARRLTALSARLSAGNPERVLLRGFAMVTSESGAPISSAITPHIGERIFVRFSDGSLISRVEEKKLSPSSQDPGSQEASKWKSQK
ncbi:MAG: exodeoxyribonuclease VII large subunit [bacterium JZ-2024 1]